MKTMTTTMTATPVSRRQLLKGGLGAALGFGLAAASLPLPGNDATKVGAAIPTLSSPVIVGGPAPKLIPIYSTPSPVIVLGPAPKLIPVAAPFTAYHGVTGAEHQSRFNALGPTGYRMISLSISGSPDDPRYAAVWVQRAGAAQRAVHGVTAAQYQQWFDAGVADGFVPTIVSATGPAAAARFAAVAEQGITGPWVARHTIDADAYDFQLVLATSNNLIPRSVAIYGDSSARRFTGVWHHDPRGIGWPSVTDVTAAQYQQSFDVLMSHGYRPRYLAVAGDGQMAAVFGDDDIGTWIARHNLTSAQYQQAFLEYTGNDMVPVCVQAGGVGSATRYAAIFVTQAAVGLYC